MTITLSRKKLTLLGTLVFAVVHLGAVETVIDAAETPQIEKETVLAVGDVLKLVGKKADFVATAPIRGAGATLYGALGSPGSCTHQAVFEAPIEFDTVLWGQDYGESKLVLKASGNRWHKFELAYAKVECAAANVLAPEGVLTWGDYYRGTLDRNATFDLGGFDQTIDRLHSTSSPGTKNSDHVVSTGGTLLMRGTADAVCFARIDGELNLVWHPTGDFTQSFDERVNSVRGRIEVRRGTVRLGKSGAFRNIDEIKVADGATFVVEATNTLALAAVKLVELGKDSALVVKGVDPFMPQQVSVVKDVGAKIESAVPLKLAREAAYDDTPPRTIRDKLQVFWDDWIVDPAMTSARRVPHHPEYVGPVITTDKPWEGASGSYMSVVKVDDVYRMYRQGMSSHESEPHYHGLKICLFESKDRGLTWERAKINRFPYKGNRENNIVIDFRVNYWDNFMAFRDDNPACPEAERYKAIALYSHKWSEEFAKAHPDYAPLAKYGKALWCFVSADGLDWKPGWPLFKFGDMGLRFDSLNVAFYDEVNREYRMYMRNVKPLEYERYGGTNARWVMVTRSKDFHNWSKPENIDFNDGQEEYELYTSGVDLYPRNPELTVGFPTRYTDRRRWSKNFERLCGRNKRVERLAPDPRHGIAITDTVFMWSRDGKTFTREEDAFFSPGPEHAGNWMYGDGYLQRGFVVSPGRYGSDDELSFYEVDGGWTGSRLTINRYALRMDGFVSYHGRYRTDKLVTKRVVFDGNRMLLNFKTSARGRVFVKITDEAGKSIVTDEIFGDKVDRIVDFEDGEVSAFAGRPVRIEFGLSDADVYSFRFEKAADAGARDACPYRGRAGEYKTEIEKTCWSNMTDEVRIPYLAALSMEYRVTAERETMLKADELFMVLKDTQRLNATVTEGQPLFGELLAVVDCHWRIARDPWQIRWFYSRLGACDHPLALAFNVKYSRNDQAKAKLKELLAAGRVRPEELPVTWDRLNNEDGYVQERFADRLVKDFDLTSQPQDAAGKARWLWAYWTMRLLNNGR